MVLDIYQGTIPISNKTNINPDCGSISKIKNAYRVDYSW